MDFPSADYLTGIGEKTFIAELMPRFPIYVNMLDKAAQDVVGKVHQNTLPALKLLQSEGFRFRGYVDIFDAGPTVEAEVSQLRTIRNSRIVTVRIGQPEVSENVLICNTKLKDFRACQADVNLCGDDVVLTQQQADALLVTAGESCAYCPSLRSTES